MRGLACVLAPMPTQIPEILHSGISAGVIEIGKKA